MSDSRVLRVEHDHSSRQTIVTWVSLDDALGALENAREVVVDTETTGLKPWHGARLCGVGLAITPELGFYLPFRHETGENLDLEEMQDLWEALRRVPQMIGYNLKFDLAVMYQDGYDPPLEQNLKDVIVAARMSAAERFPNLKLEARLDAEFGAGYSAYDKEFKAYLKKNKWAKAFYKAPIDKLGEYCVLDVLGTYRLHQAYEPFLEETLQTYIWEQEQEVTHTIWQMEKLGMGYDPEYGAQKIPQLKARIENLYTEIFSLVGHKFNLNSNPQLTTAMTSIGVKSPAKSEKTGNPSWGGGVLLNIDHPVTGKIVEVRGLEKLLGTYFEPIMSWPDRRVHGQFKNWGAVTGRMSAVEPNLQNIAKSVQNLEGNEMDDELVAAISAFLGTKHEGQFTQQSGGVTLGGAMSFATGFEDTDLTVSVRRIFVPEDGFKLYMLDYSQMEMRVFSDYVQDENLAGLLESSEFDFHAHVAKTVWGVDESSTLWDFYRTLAKSINFGLIYGIGIKKLAAQIGRSMDEAKQYREEYFARFPKAERFIQQVANVIERRGFTFNKFKRRYWIDPHKAYVGVNYLVQGSSADIVKNRMVACQKYLTGNGLKSRMLAQVHDEIIFEIHESEEAWVPFELQKIMEERQISTYLPVEVSRGAPSWAQKETWSVAKQEWVAKT